MKKHLRTGKVFVDWSQNDEHKTTVAVYSLRAREHPTASTPVTWDEVERCLKKKDAKLLVFESSQTIARYEKIGDLFEPVLKLKQKKFLNYYATRLNTVEVNFTFRQLVKETTIQNWMQESPPHFKFGVKAHQVITHIKRLKGTQDFVPRFLGTIEPLAAAGKLGPVLFQLPPNLKTDAALLKDFIATLPRTVPAAFEFRHASWFGDETWELLRSCNAALCVAET